MAERLNDLRNELEELSDISNIFIGSYDTGYIDDAIAECADNQVDIYYSDLWDWANGNEGYIDDAIDEFGWNKEKGIIGAIQMGQYKMYYDELMNDYDLIKTYLLLNYLDDLGVEELEDDVWSDLKSKLNDCDTFRSIEQLANSIKNTEEN